MILAAVSPVFDRMFYGDFKEGKSKEVDLPAESYNSTKLLIDFIHTRVCEIESLDDIVPLMELFDRYQINKAPIQRIFDETILSQLTSSNYFTLVPKYSSLMNKESHKRIADKIMNFTKNNFVSNFDEVKDLPEEVMLLLLQSDGICTYEGDILEFLIKWYNYQKEELKQQLKLTPQLFQCIRYPLIIPHLLLEKISSYDCVEKKIFEKALKSVFNYQLPVEDDHSDGEQQLVSNWNKSRIPIKIYAILKPCSYHVSVTLTFICEKRCMVSFVYGGNVKPGNCTILESHPLESRTYAFKIHNNVVPFHQFLLSIEDNKNNTLCTSTILLSGFLIIIMVYENNVFVRIVENDIVKSTNSATGVKPFRFKLQDTNAYAYGKNDFSIIAEN